MKYVINVFLVYVIHAYFRKFMKYKYRNKNKAKLSILEIMLYYFGVLHLSVFTLQICKNIFMYTYAHENILD